MRSRGHSLHDVRLRAEEKSVLKRATEIDPDNYLTHYHYASLLRRQKTPLSEESWATLRAELQKSVELAPQFVEAAEMLASVNLSRNVDIPQTVELLVKALTVSLGRDYLALQLAFAVSRTQQRESARPILRSLLANATLELPLRQSAQSLVEYLDRAARSDNANGGGPEQLSRPAERQRLADDFTEVTDLERPNLRETGRAGPPDAVTAQAVPVDRTESLSTAIGMLERSDGLHDVRQQDSRLSCQHVGRSGFPKRAQP